MDALKYNNNRRKKKSANQNHDKGSKYYSSTVRPFGRRTDSVLDTN